MEFLNVVKQKAGEFAVENATTLLTAGGVVGTVVTGILAGRGGFKFAEVLAIEKEELAHKEIATFDPGEEPTILPPVIPLKTKVKLSVICFGPSVVVGGGTIAAIIFSHRMSSAKIAGLAAAYGLAERNLSEYKEKVAEKLTGPKKKDIEADISQDRVNKADGYQTMVVVEGEVLCFDEATDRYFHSTMEKIRSAVNKVNAEIVSDDYVDASTFYNLLGLKDTQWSNEVGWNRDHMLELKYDTVTSPDGRPCIAIEFANFPRQDFIRKHY